MNRDYDNKGLGDSFEPTDRPGEKTYTFNINILWAMLGLALGVGIGLWVIAHTGI